MRVEKRDRILAMLHVYRIDRSAEYRAVPNVEHPGKASIRTFGASGRKPGGIPNAIRIGTATSRSPEL